MTDDPHAHLRADPDLAPLVDEHGPLAVEPAEDPFARLVTSVINQQLSTASAAAIRERVVEAIEVTPAGVLAADEATLRETGLSGAKVEYLQDVARAFDGGEYGPGAFAGESDEAVIDALTEIRGIGTWTAKMYLIFCLGREDVFPVEDLGIRGGMVQVVGEDLDRAAMVERADAWRPYRSYASRYLWRAYEG